PPRSGLTITPPNTPFASTPASFTVGVTSGATVKSVRVNWGDGTSTDLGAISGSGPVQKTYGSGGAYTVTATATMADNSVEPAVSTAVSVGEFTVNLSTTNISPSVNASVPFSAATTPNTTQVREYRWNFGDGTEAVTAGPSINKVYNAAGTYTVTVTVVPVVGGARSNSLVVVVAP